MANIRVHYSKTKGKKFINKPGWKGYKKEIMLIQALIWKLMDRFEPVK